MKPQLITSREVEGTVMEVMPSTGLAYLTGEDNMSWAVTRSTRGTGLQALRPGQRLRLKVVQHAEFAVVSEYAALD